MVNQTAPLPRTAVAPFPGFSLDALRSGAEAVLIPIGALLATAVVFGIFVAAAGADPLETYSLMYRGAFGTWFSWQNTLQRTAPLLLTALCVVLPAKLGLVIIGGEGALVIGGLVSAAVGTTLIGMPSWLLLGLMAIAGMAAGRVWIALAGALRQFRGVNETISSLLLYPGHLRTRKSSGAMMRKLSVTLSHSVLHLLGTSRRRKPSTASQKPL